MKILSFETSSLPAPGVTHYPKANLRLHTLDGIRGWAALSVVCFHIFYEIFGVRFPIYRNIWTSSILDGNLAVSIFFVLSGEALSVGFLAGAGRRFVVDLSLRRYTRLVIPIFFTCLLVYVLALGGLCFNRAAGQIVGRPEWLGAFIAHRVSFTDVLKFSLFDVFKDLNVGNALDPFLWTMRLELFGSILTFVLLLIFAGKRWAWLAIGVLMVLFFGLSVCLRLHSFLQLTCFLAGIIFGQLRISGVFAKAHDSKSVNLTALGLIVVLMSLDAVFQTTAKFGGRGPIFAIALTGLVFLSRSATGFMVSPLSQWLGRISFPLFLV